jgi:hypothetical protein
MTKEESKGDNRSVNITGGRVGVLSTGDNAHIQINAMNLDALPADDADQKAKLEALLAQLNELLQQAPLEKQDDAKAVAKTTENLIQEASAENPNKSMLKVTASGMKEAAQAIAGVVPSAIKVVKEISDTVMGMVM